MNPFALVQHLQALSRPRNPTHHVEAHLEARRYLSQALERMGRTVMEQPFCTHLGVEGVNLMSGPAQATVLVVAHYDTVDNSPGADDNTSAVAIALELARLHPEVAVLFPDLEERDLLGSRHFVQTDHWRDARGLVLESVGYWCEEPNSQGYPPLIETFFPEQFEALRGSQFRGDFWALLAREQEAESSRRLAECLSSRHLEFMLPDAVTDLRKGQGLSDFGRSDHLAFWEAGRPCLMLTDTANFRNPNYHQPGDLMESLNLSQMELLLQDLSRWCQRMLI